MTDLVAGLAALAREVEAALDRFLPQEAAYPARIHQAMRYSTLGGGKRLRGALCLTAAEAVGGERTRALPAAAALEMIHAYSLIHDDLPCMDDDALRRGKPTNHKVFGEGIAVLTGDALLTHALGLLAQQPELVGLPSAAALAMLADVAEAAGTGGLIGGQVVDLESEGSGPAPDAAVIEYIHRHKTGAMFEASVRCGARAGAGGEAAIAALTVYATAFGLAFQIVDDLLDVEGEAAELGKAVGSDLRREKATYPRLFGIAASREKARSCVAEAKAALRPLGQGAAVQFLADLADFVVDRRS